MYKQIQSIRVICLSFFLLVIDTTVYTYIHLIPYKYLCNLKKKVKNIEAFIFVEEILTFISYYFESYLRRKINRIPKNDDGGEVPSNGYLSIFFNPG